MKLEKVSDVDKHFRSEGFQVKQDEDRISKIMREGLGQMILRLVEVEIPMLYNPR